LIAGFGLAGTAALAGAAAPPVFEALRWTAPGAELVVLSEQPEHCVLFTRGTDRQLINAPLINAGKALFNTPTLLGGQAAKAGLSCASCHVNGRNNPHFSLSGVSDRAGTADVTSSFFSTTRGNAKFDPVPIPDLAAPGKVSRAPESGALEPFIRSLIVEEFSGAEPGSNAIAALAAYVRAIRACTPDGDGAILRQLSDQTGLIETAIRGHKEMIKRGDAKSAQLLIAAARHQLLLIHERFAGSVFARERKALLSASTKLQQISQMSDLAAQGTALKLWQTDFERGLVQRLILKLPKSFYDPRRLAKQFPPMGATPSKH
jgi:hypothetical protein